MSNVSFYLSRLWRRLYLRSVKSASLSGGSPNLFAPTVIMITLRMLALRKVFTAQSSSSEGVIIRVKHGAVVTVTPAEEVPLMARTPDRVEVVSVAHPDTQAEMVATAVKVVNAK